jgi:Fic family protein
MFFLRGITEQATDANSRAKRLQDLQIEWRQRLMQARASALPLRLVDNLFDSPVLSISQAQSILEVTYHSARRCVERLVQAGILRQQKEAAYGKTFVANEIFQIVGESGA